MAVILSPRGNEASNMMKRFVRYEEAAQYFGLDETLIIAYAKAAGAVYQLCKIRLIKIEPLEDYMKHLTKVGRSSKLIQRKFVRVGEGTLTLWFMVKAYFFHDPINRSLTGNMHSFRLFEL